jgi:hypothetical protein
LPPPGAITRRKAGFYASDSICSGPASPAVAAKARQRLSQFECFKSLTTKEAALLPSETAIAETATTFDAQLRREAHRGQKPGAAAQNQGRAIAQENTNCSAYYV